MNRVVRELTADEVHRHGGTKIGDFGTGGRTYSTYSRGATAQSNDTCLRIIVFVILAIAGVWLWAIEDDFVKTNGCAKDALDAVVVHGVPEPSALTENDLVFVAAGPGRLPTVRPPVPFDPYFGITVAEGAASLRRVTEYCQWQEFRHHNRVKVGRDPNCRANDDSCNIYRDDVSFTYLKGWHPYRIMSATFDNPAAYHNPQRDPAPSAEFHATGDVDLSGGRSATPFLVAPVDIQSGLTSWTRVPLSRARAHSVTHQALNGGFHEADHNYIYSRVPKDGWDNPVVKAAMSYLVDGVIDVNNIAAASGVEGMLKSAGLDWIVKGTCNAGDVRVHFESKEIDPKGVALVGRQVGNRVVAYRCSSGRVTVLSYPDGTLSQSAFVGRIVSDAQFWARLSRLGVLAVSLLAVFLVCPTRFDQGVALVGSCAGWTLLWLQFYQASGTVMPAVATLIAAGLALYWKDATVVDGRKPE